MEKHLEEHVKSLALQYDLFVNSTLKLLDTSTERDYLLKLKIIDDLACRINESETDKKTIKDSLEAIQDECLKLTYKLKTSARLLDEVRVEKEKLELEKEVLKSQLEQLYGALKKPDTTEKISMPRSHSIGTDGIQDRKKTLNNTDALLSDISYSNSEDSSYDNILKNSEHHNLPLKSSSKNSKLNKKNQESLISSSKYPNVNTKTCEIKDIQFDGGKIIATTTMTMDLGRVNAKSVIKAHQSPSSKTVVISSDSDSIESLSSSEEETEFKPTDSNNLNTNIKKNHNFVQKVIVIPEICGVCHKKIKFNYQMVKCLDCKIIAHLECKDGIPTVCSFDEDKLNALNCGIPPIIVNCINEIEQRGLNTVGIYRASASDKEVKMLRDKFCKGVPSLNNVDIHVLCNCLKDFMCMPNNRLITQSDLSKLAGALKEKDVSKSLCQNVLELSSSNRKILAFLILHLQKVASSPKCFMDYNCLAIVFGPIICGVSSSNLDDLLIKSETIFKIVIELIKMPKSFWQSLIKVDCSSSDELLHSTPTRTPSQSRTPRSAHRFFPSGLKRRILTSPKEVKQNKTKQVEFENKNKN